MGLDSMGGLGLREPIARSIGMTVLIRTAIDRWNLLIIVDRRRRGGGPFEGIGFPGIVGGHLAFKNAPEKIENEKTLCRKHANGANRHEGSNRRQMGQTRIKVRIKEAPGLTGNTQNKHRVEHKIEENEGK